VSPQWHQRVRAVVTAGAMAALLLANTSRGPAGGETGQPAQEQRPAQQIAPKLAMAPFNAAEAREHQQRWAKYLGVPLEITNSVGMKLVLIPPGEFMRGPTPDQQTGNLPPILQQHVRISKPFYFGAYEVTQEQYQKVMGQNPSQFQAGALLPQDKEANTRQWPVEFVTWEEVHEFCKRLGTKEKRTYRLPTEAEWEYACRAGTTTPYHFGTKLNGREANCDGRFPYGTEVPGQHWNRPVKVGAYPPNAFGLYDMHGNVAEYVMGVSLGENRQQTLVDPVGRTSHRDRIARGGGLRSHAERCQAVWGLYVQYWPEPMVGADDFGFRVLCVVGKP